MTRAWIFLLGIMGIVTTSCLGFAMNRSDTDILIPAIWPGPNFKADRRVSMQMLLNRKIHAGDMNSILRDTDAKQPAKEEEKCSSCSDDQLRVRRSDGILNQDNQLTISHKNSSEFNESANVSSSSLESRASEPRTSESKASELRTSQPTASEQKTLEPKASEPKISEPKISEPKISEPKISEPKISEPKTLEPKASEPKTLEPKASEPKSPEPKALEPKALEPKAPEPKVLEPKASKMKASELKASEPKTLEGKTLDVTSEKSSDSEVPHNVILLLVENAGPDRESMWESFEAAHEFSVRGFLQNCRSSELSEGSKFSLSESLVSGGRDECECERLLRANVGSLLSWARYMKDMATGAVSATNFSIPSPRGYERLPSHQAVKEPEANDEINGMKYPRRSRPELRSNWHPIELQKQSSLSSSTSTVKAETATKQDVLNGYDGMWDVFDMFSRIRMAFFRILLESLGNLSGPEDEFSGRRPFSVQPSVVELVSDTLRELKSVASDPGFMMVVAAPGNELSAVVDVLQSELTVEDTLLVVAGMCSESNAPVPFFANGPGGKALQNDQTIWDVPGSIRGVISSGCGGEICKNKRREDLLALPSIELPSFTHDLPRKRVVRAKEEDETTSSTGEDKTTKDSVDADNNPDEKTTVPEMERRSGAPISRVDNVAAILGIVTSITAMLALNS